MAITDLHTFGFQKETELKQRLEDALGEELTKTKGRYDAFDFTGNSHCVELKSRRAPILPDTYPTWLLPTSKTPKVKTDKETIFFYYFEADNSLHYIFYDEDLFNTFEKVRPYWHPQKQEHFLIPRNRWTHLEGV